VIRVEKDVQCLQEWFANNCSWGRGLEWLDNVWKVRQESLLFLPPRKRCPNKEHLNWKIEDIRPVVSRLDLRIKKSIANYNYLGTVEDNYPNDIRGLNWNPDLSQMCSKIGIRYPEAVWRNWWFCLPCFDNGPQWTRILGVSSKQDDKAFRFENVFLSVQLYHSTVKYGRLGKIR